MVRSGQATVKHTAPLAAQWRWVVRSAPSAPLQIYGAVMVTTLTPPKVSSLPDGVSAVT